MTPAAKATEAPCTSWSDRISAMFLSSHVFPDGGISHDADWIVISFGFYILVILLAIPFGAGDWLYFKGFCAVASSAARCFFSSGFVFSVEYIHGGWTTRL